MIQNPNSPANQTSGQLAQMMGPQTAPPAAPLSPTGQILEALNQTEASPANRTALAQTVKGMSDEELAALQAELPHINLHRVWQNVIAKAMRERLTTCKPRSRPSSLSNRSTGWKG